MLNKLIEKLSPVLDKVGLIAVEKPKVEEQQKVEEQPNVEIEDTKVEEVLAEVEKEKIIEAAQEEAEKIVDEENKEITNLKTMVTDLQKTIEEQNKMFLEQQAKLKELLDKTPAIPSISREEPVIEKKSAADLRYEAYQKLRK